MSDAELQEFIKMAGYNNVQRFLKKVADDCFGNQENSLGSVSMESAGLCVRQYLSFKD
jgi:hypothetical protein